MSKEDYIVMKQLLNDVNQPVSGSPVIEKLRQAIVNHDTQKVKTYAKQCLNEGALANGFVMKLLEKHNLTQTI